MSPVRRVVLCGLMTAGLVLCCGSSAALGQQVDPDHVEKAKRGMALFKSDVRQILSQHCLECHGGGSIKADFDLSTRESLMASGFVGKTADESHLVQLIRHTAEPHMPFKADKLSDEQIEKVVQWIELGAPYDQPLAGKPDAAPGAMVVSDKDRQFWSFRTLEAVTPPSPTDQQWCQNPIDNFIRVRQESVGLHPNPTADRRVLIRRAYLDLLGLPPQPAEVDAFVNDPAGDSEAWAKLIDRLLESPQYGERWARHWMDVARFAESHGYEQDYDRPTAYHYRDFLIRALNADLPYDKFLQWQLAGDELAPNDPMAVMATGFLGAGAFPTQLTEAEFETARYDELDDMVMTTGVAFLGLSVGCARCHDHKFDPIPSMDYYRLAATFATAIRAETDLDLEPAENLRRRKEHELAIQQKEEQLHRYATEQLPTAFQNWLRDPNVQIATDVWEPLRIISVSSDAGTKLEVLEDGSVLSTGSPAAKETITLVGESFRKDVRSLRLEALAHESLPQKGPGRAGNGNFVLSDLAVEVITSASTGQEATQQLKLQNPRATHQQNADSLSIAASLDTDPVSGWAVDQGGIGHDQAAVFDLGQPLTSDGVVRWTIRLHFNHPNTQHTLGHFRLSVTNVTDARPEIGRVGVSDEVVQAIEAVRKQPEETSDAWKTAYAWYRGQDAEMVRLTGELQGLKNCGPEIRLARALITSEGLPHLSHHADDRGFPHFYPEVHLLKRGDVHQKQDVMQAGYLQVLMPAQADATLWKVDPPADWTRTSFRRASLARWMTDTKNGAGSLAARVIVNRLWQHHFGRGIVASPNDFGVSGERPTHPELLEWLANDLVSHGWQLKRMHRLIMTSHTYMQNGDHDEARATVDRDNQLHWRRAPRRLEAEAIRDSMLAVSGRLDPTMYGPGTLDQNMTRRSIYFFIKRSQLIPMMMLFDWPEHLVSIGQRPVTTIAPQALMFMNSPQGRDYATAFANRLKESDATPLQTAWRLAFGRQPSDVELSAAEKFLVRQAQVHREAGHADADRQALIDLCQTLMSMNEFVYVE